MKVKSEIYSGLTEIFHDIFLRDTITLTPATTAADVEGWDSFKQLEIVLAAEARWGVRFSTRELDGLACVGDLAQAIAAKAG